MGLLDSEQYNEIATPVIGVAIVVVIAIVLISSYHSGSKRWKDCTNFMHGFWKADHSWCDKAGIGNVYASMNMDPSYNKGTMYLVIQDNNDNLLDNDYYPFDLSVSSMELLNRHASGNIECDLMFTDGSPAQGMIPQVCKLRTNVSSGVMALHDNDTVFLELFKDNITTSYMTNRETYLPERPRTDPQSDVYPDDPNGINSSGLGEIDGKPRKFESNSIVRGITETFKSLFGKDSKSEGYLPERPRTDPQHDVYPDDPNGINSSGLGHINGRSQEFRANARPERSKVSEGERILPPVDQSEGEVITSED